MKASEAASVGGLFQFGRGRAGLVAHRHRHIGVPCGGRDRRQPAKRRAPAASLRLGKGPIRDLTAYRHQKLASSSRRFTVGPRFTGTGQEFSFDRPVRRGGTPAVLPMVIVTGNAHIHPQSPLPSRFARSSRSLRWRHRPLTLHASRGFSGVPANQSIDQEFSGNCHSQKRYSRPPVRPSMRRHAKKRNRARHDQARPVESTVTRPSPC